jgi:CheY-like chemotaxis protein
MVNAHGGIIKAESSGKNRGATFIVTLATVAAPAAIAAPVLGRGGPKGPRLKTAQAKGTGPRILVVDDHVDTCTGMKMMLERRGYRVTVAHTADEAAGKAQHEEFDLVISDIGLPDRSGYELMRELSTTKALRGIALSGFGMENDVSRARAAGFSEHLTKPINFDRLDEAIQMLLGEPEAAVRS